MEGRAPPQRRAPSTVRRLCDHSATSLSVSVPVPLPESLPPAQVSTVGSSCVLKALVGTALLVCGEVRGTTPVHRWGQGGSTAERDRRARAQRIPAQRSSSRREESVCLRPAWAVRPRHRRSLGCSREWHRKHVPFTAAPSRPHFIPTLGVCGTSPVLQQGTDLCPRSPLAPAFLWPLALGKVAGERRAQRAQSSCAASALGLLRSPLWPSITVLTCPWTRWGKGSEGGDLVNTAQLDCPADSCPAPPTPPCQPLQAQPRLYQQPVQDSASPGGHQGGCWWNF